MSSRPLGERASAGPPAASHLLAGLRGRAAGGGAGVSDVRFGSWCSQKSLGEASQVAGPLSAPSDICCSAAWAVRGPAGFSRRRKGTGPGRKAKAFVGWTPQLLSVRRHPPTCVLAPLSCLAGPTRWWCLWRGRGWWTRSGRSPAGAAPMRRSSASAARSLRRWVHPFVRFHPEAGGAALQRRQQQQPRPGGPAGWQQRNYGAVAQRLQAVLPLMVLPCAANALARAACSVLGTFLRSWSLDWWPVSRSCRGMLI